MPSKDRARGEMGMGVCGFPDGSWYEGGVRAAAVVMKGRKINTHKTKCLTSGGEHIVFESEVAGAILALDIVSSTPWLTNVNIFMDCQVPTCNHSGRPHESSAGPIPAGHTHVGITGNHEGVDARTEEAALGTSSPSANPPHQWRLRKGFPRAG